MTLDEIEAMPGERIGTKEISELYGLSRADVLEKAYTKDPLQRWPFPFTFNGNRLMVPKAAFLDWARGARRAGSNAELASLLTAILSTLTELRQAQLRGAGRRRA